MRRLPPLSAVKVFEAAARHENFTRAAAELGMTQAAVSYQIRLLEDRLGIPLFLRSKRRVTLSEAGRRAAPLVARAFDTLADAFGSVVSEDENVLAISTTQTFASNWIAPRLGAFQLARPELAVRLHTENRVIDFAREEIDVAIRSTSAVGEWPGLKSHFMFRLHSTPVAAPACREAYRIAAPEDLLRVPRLTPDDVWWSHWLRAAGLPVPDEGATAGIRFDAQAMEGQAVLSGAGVAMLTPLFWRAELASGRLIQLFDAVSVSDTAYWLVYPEHRRNQAKIRAFRDWILAEVEAMSASEPAEIFVPAAAPPA
ncbi:MAG TPA: LysR substrate-binding domain-containing protein [Allosphingosinicella sp.]|jgi:LysR family glycine cleavage system transcriptional activator